MAAFAWPAFYDGRIRFNLEGRESVGRVALRDYHAACDRVTALLEACRDLRTGAPAVDRIERAAPADPLDLAPTGCDLIVRWRGAPVGFDHPEHGRIGPLPYRRTGGHTGGPGVAYIAADGVAPGRHGLVSAFDLVPTVIDMLGAPCPPGLSGTSRYAMIRAPAGSAAGSAEGRAFRVQR
jgi:predicted AlkP superfamily phosphohydrolase/phosphomutase